MFIRKIIENNYEKMGRLIKKTPLEYNVRLSKKYDANIYLKREDLQFTRSFKIRGVCMKLIKSDIDKNKVIVCSSAGNHAQSIAYLSNILNMKCHIFLPETAQKQKISSIQRISDPKLCQIHFAGKVFDECLIASKKFSEMHESIYIHPFDDLDIIAGQGTIGYELERDLELDLDIIIVPIGGGGLISGIASYMKNNNNKKPLIYGVESENNDSMRQSIMNGQIIKLINDDSFVDGTAVKQPGIETFKLCKEYVDEYMTIENNHACHDLVDLYQYNGIVAELSGVLPISSLDLIKDKIKGKNICCILSGGNNDILRLNEIYRRKLLWETK